MQEILKEKVKEIKMLAKDIYQVDIFSDTISENALPGQFVNIKCCNGLDAYLRRPISIMNVDKDNKSFSIVFQAKGKGTNLLCSVEPGQQIDLLGPLGKGFQISKDYKKIAVIGGGIGVFPLLYLLNKSLANEKDVFLGFRDKSAVVLEKEFNDAGTELFITTDDGSYKEKGFITNALKDQMQNKTYDMIYACGPTPMLKIVTDIAKEFDTLCQVSMEQRMGCGIGACLVCACKVKKEDDWDYGHVCKDGPVFWSTEVMFD